jgi:5-aminopentanamidase
MIIDPFGDVIVECRKLEDEFVIGYLTKEKLTKAGGFRYRKARKPELYGHVLSQGHESQQNVSWLK